MSDTATASSAAAAYHYQSGRFFQSLIELERYDKRWEDERRLLWMPPSGSSLSEVGTNNNHNDEGEEEEDDDDDAIIITADNIDNNLSGNQPQSRSHNIATKRVELMALPLLARRSDVAMIRFRQALLTLPPSAETMTEASTSSSFESSAVGGSSFSKESILSSSPSLPTKNLLVLWEEAMSSNRIYRRSLLGAAMSLVQSFKLSSSLKKCTESEERVGERDVPNTSAIDQKQKTRNDHKSIRQAMKETSLAMLMAGIAASHLYLYHHEGRIHTDRNNCSRENSRLSKRHKGKYEDAWKVLVDSAKSAADLLLVRKYLTEGNSSDLTSEGSLEESLRILNLMICKRDEYDEKRCNDDNETIVSDDDHDEIERGNLAMHTFRSALSVAAIATGRLILPKLTTQSRVEETMSKNPCHEPKRQRRTEHDEERKKHTHNCDVKVTVNEDGSLNFSYSHSSSMMHSQNKLVDAISFHLASNRYHSRREILVNLRDICFHEAVEWENRAAAEAVNDIDDDDDNGMLVGYSWKVMNCLHGLEVASLCSNPQTRDDTNVNADGRQKADREKLKRVVATLELLSTSSSRFANDWLGCVYASEKGGYVRALDKFQLSLDIGERWSNRSDADEETDERRGLAERRTTFNLALCFLAMGEANAPLELLLHLWMTLSEISPVLNTTNDVTIPRAAALLLSPVGYELESDDWLPDQFMKLDALWKLFQISSISQDWSTCLNSSEEIMLHGKECSDMNYNSHVELAHAFALLQCRRSSAAQEITRSLIQKLASKDEDGTLPVHLLPSSLLLSVAALYHADALMLNEQYNKYLNKDDTPPRCTQRAVAAFDAGLKTLINGVVDDATRNASLRELQIITYNDHAISLLLSGDSVGALRYFREAVVCGGQARDAQECWLLMPIYFNLSLLLMRDGHVEESAKSWLQLRGYFSVWQHALRGHDNALQRMKELHATAINSHSQLMAKRNMQRITMLWGQENILEWVPPAAVKQDEVIEDSNRVGGVDASQVTALDVLLLKYACSTAEKKSSSSFRQKSGRLG